MPKDKKYKNVLPMILVILDGWGIAPASRGNAVTLSRTPVMDAITKKYPYTLLKASGRSVGLPPKQPGNSEAGHMNLGAGRVVNQDAVIISKSINQGTFFKNPAFLEAIKNVQEKKSNLHIMGMLSNGESAHSDPDHLLALLTLARLKKIHNVYLHLFTDGRDSPRYASLKLIEDIKKTFKNGEAIATIMGRYYAMDRKKKWSNTEKAYNALVLGKGRKAGSAEAAITESYNRGDSDEFIEPYVITHKGKPWPRISDNDSVIFFNLRSDRARQLAKTFAQKHFCEKNCSCFIPAKRLKDIIFIAMTDFGPDLGNIISAFPGADIKDTLPMVLKDLSQAYIAETEKYAHVTYFFNGGYSGKVNGEEQIMIPSPDVKSYDKTPLMSSEALTDAVLLSLKEKKYEFTVLNLAAPDMIGHTGNLKAGIECVAGVDRCLGKIIDAYRKAGGTVLVTADHGNIEEMINLETGEINTEHSSNPVPFVLVSDSLKKTALKSGRALSDIAPTALSLLEIKKPPLMKGESLIK
ncbi:MAG: 2,3-bisphosphoglycerate-independent phosphoglycerate mutase [Patescibacteria group bacterium]|jgi:2,3-bisphosphoglycerate-independent phosphoglycerate mutase